MNSKPENDPPVRCSAWLGGVAMSIRAAASGLNRAVCIARYRCETLYLCARLLQLRLKLRYRDIALLYLRRQLGNLRAKTGVVGKSFQNVVYDFESGNHGGVEPSNMYSAKRGFGRARIGLA